MKGAIKVRTETINKPNFKVIENKTLSDDIDIKELPKMKTLKEMVLLTGLSYTYLRHLCLNNEIVHIRAGNKYLINYDRFIDYLNGVRI